MSKRNYELYAFVASAALEKSKPFVLDCNCGGKVTVMPPFQDEYVVCALCESSIKMLVLEGDPGYIIGANADGTPTLLPVQGSSAPHPNTLPKEEIERILKNAPRAKGNKGG